MSELKSCPLCYGEGCLSRQTGDNEWEAPVQCPLCAVMEEFPQLKSVICRTQDEGGWQPIETAPKDGSEILTCNVNCGGVMRLIYWYRTHEQWREKGNVIVCLHDTHWMPLPDKPPTSEGEG